jgi:hypothetical protein
LGAWVRIPLVELPGGKQGNLKRVQGNVISACKGDRMHPSARLDNPQGTEVPIIWTNSFFSISLQCITPRKWNGGRIIK